MAEKTINQAASAAAVVKLYRQKKIIREIAEICRLTKQEVREKLVAAKLKKPLKYQLIDRRILERLFLLERLPIKSIAARFKTDRVVIRQALAYQGNSPFAPS